MAAWFISAQLELESPRPLGHVLDAFSGSGIISFDYRESKRGFAVAFEYSEAGSSTDPDAQVALFCDIIDNLKEQPKSVWNGAYRRTFNLEVTRSTRRRGAFGPSSSRRRSNRSRNWELR